MITDIEAVGRVYDVPDEVALIIIDLWRQRQLPRAKLQQIVASDYEGKSDQELELLRDPERWTDLVKTPKRQDKEWQRVLSRTYRRQAESVVRKIGLPVSL